jgi:hypothetical protein
MPPLSKPKTLYYQDFWNQQYWELRKAGAARRSNESLGAAKRTKEKNMLPFAQEENQRN